MIASVFGLAFAGAAQAGLVVGTVDPFTVAASASNGTTANTYTQDTSSTVTGGLWTSRAIGAAVSSATNTSAQASVSAGNFVFSIAPVTSTNSTQRARVTYSSTGAGPDFTNFTSLSFDYNSTFSFGVRVWIAGMTPSAAGNFLQLQNQAAGSGTLTFTAAQFAIPSGSLGNVSGMYVEFFRMNTNTSGSLTMTNLVANGVPAPGAIALLGAAGLIGGTRRRR
jgi:hypothetical protein